MRKKEKSDAYVNSLFILLHHQGYVADLRETVIQIILGLESSVSERAASPPSLSSEYDHPDKQAAMNALRSISNK